MTKITIITAYFMQGALILIPLVVMLMIVRLLFGKPILSIDWNYLHPLPILLLVLGTLAAGIFFGWLMTLVLDWRKK